MLYRQEDGFKCLTNNVQGLGHPWHIHGEGEPLITPLSFRKSYPAATAASLKEVVKHPNWEMQAESNIVSEISVIVSLLLSIIMSKSALPSNTKKTLHFSFPFFFSLISFF